jgi:hypothetical protein
LTEPAAPVFPPITTSYLLIFVPEPPDHERLCKGALVVLVLLPHILLALRAKPFVSSLAGRSDVGSDLYTLKVFRLTF